MSAKSNRKTKQSFLNISSAVIDVSNVSRDENPQTENEMDSPSFEVFLQLAGLQAYLQK